MLTELIWTLLSTRKKCIELIIFTQTASNCLGENIHKNVFTISYFIKDLSSWWMNDIKELYNELVIAYLVNESLIRLFLSIDPESYT